MFSCSRTNFKFPNHTEEVDAGKKTRRRTCGGEIEANVEFGIKERESISDAVFGCIIRLGEIVECKVGIQILQTSRSRSREK